MPAYQGKWDKDLNLMFGLHELADSKIDPILVISAEKASDYQLDIFVQWGGAEQNENTQRPGISAYHFVYFI